MRLSAPRPINHVSQHLSSVTTSIRPPASNNIPGHRRGAEAPGRSRTWVISHGKGAELTPRLRRKAVVVWDIWIQAHPQQAAPHSSVPVLSEKTQRKRRGDVCWHPSLLQRSGGEDGNPALQLLPGRYLGSGISLRLTSAAEAGQGQGLVPVQRRSRATRAIKANGWEVAMNKSAAT